MRPWLLAATLIGLLAPTTLAAEASGELTSDAPVRLFGDGQAVGSDLFLYHYAFRDGSFSGKVYSGTLTEHRWFQVAEGQPFACYSEYEGRHEFEKALVADPQTPYNVIDFGLVTGAFARTKFPNGLGFSISSVGDPQDSSEPFAYLGPNPYPHQGGVSGGASGTIGGDEPPEAGADPFVPAFATDAFAAVPARAFNTVSSMNMELYWGEIKTVQRERERTFSAGVAEEPRPNPAPNPITPDPECKVIVTRWIEFDQITVVASIDQSGAERALAYWRGEGSAQSADEMPGHWERSRGADFAKALEDRNLPATLLAAPDFHLELSGRAQFYNALGSISVGGLPHEAKDATMTLHGHPTLKPVASDGAQRMTTRVGGDVATASVGGVADDGWTWTLDVPATFAFAAGLSAVAAAAWAWPLLKLKGTQWLLFPLYARLKKEDVLENPLRDDILVVVQGSPGISASELGRRLECGWGTLVYHLTVLERMQLISSAREGRHKRFFVQGRINYSDKGAVGLLANPSARTLLDAIRERPGLIQRDLGRLLGLSPGTVAWHVDRLEEAGLVIKEEEGRVVRYYPSAKLLELTRQLAA